MKDKDSKVRRNAAASLGAFARESAQIIPVLIGLLSDDDVEVRRAAIVSLGTVGKGSEPAKEAVFKHIDDPDPVTKIDAVVAAAALGRRDDAVIPILIEALGSQEESTSKAARIAVTDIGLEDAQKVIPGLMECLEKQGDPRMVNAVRVLGNMKDKAVEALPKLSAAYDKVEASKRHHVADALLAVDEPGTYAVPVLKRSLQSVDPLDRKDAMMGLMRFRSDPSKVLDAFVRELSDPDFENKLLAVSIIRGLGEKGAAAFPALKPMAQDRHVQIRGAVVNAIGAMKPQSLDALKVLAETVRDPEVRVRLASVQALRSMALLYPDEVTTILTAAYEQEKFENVRKAIIAAVKSRPRPEPLQRSQAQATDKTDDPAKPMH